MLFYFLIGFVTFIGSGIVIYSIFYISVASSIRNYGQLRTIGTTKRQIKKMVYREGKLLAAIAIPIGLVIGNVIGYFLIPAGWYWLTTLCVTVGVGLFAFIIVMIAIHTPVKRAAAVSPLEALRYSDYQGKMKESSVLHRKITPASLAKMNLSRQKAKSTLTILSLSLGGVLVVLISTMLVSYDGVAEARGRAFPVGEFNIQLNANQSWDTAGISLSGLQQKNFLNADFLNAVESIDGVTGIKHWYYTDAEYRVNGNSGKWIQGFCRDEQQNLEKERIAGTTDYDELVAGNGIVLLQERADLYDMRRGATLCMDKMKGLLLQDKLVEYAYRQLSGEKAPTFHKLLFVYAEDTSAEVLRAAMLQKGFDLILVSSIWEAKRRIFEDKEIELILCDLELPDGTAMELFHTLRRVAGMFQMKNPPVRLLPFFILTENNDPATEYEYRHEGVNDYITAPVNIPELIRRVLFFVE